MQCYVICYQWLKQGLMTSKPSIGQRSQFKEDTVEPSVVAWEFNLKAYIAIIIITDFYSAFRSDDTEALDTNDPASMGLEPRLVSHHSQAVCTVTLPTGLPGRPSLEDCDRENYSSQVKTDNGGGSGAGCFEVQIWADTAKFMNFAVARFRTRKDLVWEDEVFVKNKAKVASKRGCWVVLRDTVKYKKLGCCREAARCFVFVCSQLQHTYSAGFLLPITAVSDLLVHKILLCLGYPMVKNFRRYAYLYSFWRNLRTWQTHRQTDGWTVSMTAQAALMHCIVRQKRPAQSCEFRFICFFMCLFRYSKRKSSA